MSTFQPMVRAGARHVISVADLMPPEKFYRPIRGMGLSSTLMTATLFFTCFVVSSSLLPVAVLAGFMFARIASHRVAYGAAVEQNQMAVNLLNAGRVDAAAEIFDQLTKTERRTAAHAVYVFNRAVAYMLQGRPRRAYSLFNAVLRSGAFDRPGTNVYLPLLHIEIGTCLALMGELETAREHRDKADRLLDGNERGRLSFLDALLLCRAGRYAETIRQIEVHTHLAESQLRRPTLKALRLVHAFAAYKLGDAGAASRIVRGMHLDPGEFEWLLASWPELRALPL